MAVIDSISAPVPEAASTPLPKIDVAAGSRVVVAMSGGVDSSVTAAICKARGYEVVGITLQLYDQGTALNRKGACCAGQDIHDARRVAASLGIPHYVLDYEARFRESVIDDFADTYLAGETTGSLRPLQPDSEVPRSGGRGTRSRRRGPGDRALRAAHSRAGRSRDAPAGRFSRGTRAISCSQPRANNSRICASRSAVSTRRGLAHWPPVSTYPSPPNPTVRISVSCPAVSYADVVTRLRPGAIEPGDIVHVDGRVVGRHDGVIGFTVGQRRGLGVGGEAAPLYVVRLEPESRRVVESDPARRCWGGSSGPGTSIGSGMRRRAGDGIRVAVKVRSTHAPVPAAVVPDEAGGACVALDRPEAGLAPGQAAVFYDGDRVLGGGWICRFPGR